MFCANALCIRHPANIEVLHNFCTTSVIVSYQRFISALKDIAHKMPAPSFHRLPANEAKVIYVTNTLKRKILDK